MGKSDLMDRVAADLARGHTHPAIQRLHSLIAAHPTDLDLRRRLAAVYRTIGNASEAGRWSYLDDNADPEEVSAFERSFPSPVHRRAALRWPLDALAPTEFAREQLDRLPVPEAAATSADRPLWTGLRMAGACVIGALALVGFYAVVEWLLG
jgi:hypothetical protein